MSQRLGMADGRCFTITNSAKLFDNYVMSQNNISFEDNYSYRKLLQQKGPELFKINDDVVKCGWCAKSSPDLSKIY